MRVSVRFFSFLSSLIGTRQVELCLPANARVTDLSQRLQEMYPEHATLLAHLVYMVDHRNATPETELVDGAEVLALMVLSGG
jgi:molybdopterin converting factor small subunit